MRAWTWSLALGVAAYGVAPVAGVGQDVGSVRELRLEPVSEGVTLTIVTGVRPDFDHFQLADPSRIVLDIQGMSHRLPRMDYPEARVGPVQGIRTSQFAASTVRIVIDLERAVPYLAVQSGQTLRVTLFSGRTESDPWSTDTTATPADPAPLPVEPAPTVGVARVSGDTVSRPVEDGQQGLEATVTRLAGQTIYLDMGTEAGLAEGDTLVVNGQSGIPAPAEPSGVEHLLLVLAAAEERAVVTFAASPFPVTRGSVLFLAAPAGSSAVADSAPESPPDRHPTAATQLSTSRDLATGPDVTGRLFFDVNAFQSTTQWADGSGSASRTFVTPTGRLLLTISDLPGGFRMDTNVRASYRQGPIGLSSTPGSLRFYELSLEKTFDRFPARIQLGRFYNPFESFSGYWDGALLRLGGRGAGLGFAAGYEPTLGNEGFSTDLPKMSAFANVERVGARGGIATDVSVHSVTPTNGLLDHTFLGWAGRAWYGSAQVSHDVQIDRDPESGDWVLTDVRVSGSLPVGNRIRVFGRFQQRQPYYFWRMTDIISYRRDGLAGGANVLFDGGSVGMDVTVNRQDGEDWGAAYSGSYQLSRVGGVLLTGYASYWSDARSDGLSFSQGIGRSFGRADARLGYRYYNSTSIWHELRSHSVDGQLALPIRDGLRWTVQGSAGWGGNLRSTRFYSGLWKMF